MKPVRLTTREVQVLELAARGLSAKESARELGISKRTVDYHRASAYERLMVSNVVSAIRLAERLGLLAFEPRDRR